MNRKQIMFFSLLFAVLMTMFWSEQSFGMQREISEKVVRLHVLANSNSEEDQAVKLKVRDAVLCETEAILKSAGDQNEAAKKLRESLPALEETAEKVLMEEGMSYGAKATLSWEVYPTRQYESFALPAGRYVSLRLSLGEARGQNWWCVVFPPLCTAATEEQFRDSAESAGLSTKELALLTEESESYEIRFKTLELFTDLFA